MADPFVAEIRIFPFYFAPKGWAFCNGQLIQLSQNTALFALLGTTYGGDGKSTFALPNLQGRAPMQWGNGPGLSPRTIGESNGAETVTLTAAQLPVHSHQARASTGNGSQYAPAGAVWASDAGGAAFYGASPNTHMNAGAVANSGGGAPHNNMQPYLAMSFCIALQGIFPQPG
ncbi:MAG TPA: phage tail protein [Solibacterales bacterium]|nr:phage tail protein [Bryobacterales bacterium]